MAIRSLLTVKDAAEFLGIHLREVYRRANNGEIPGIQLGGTIWRFRQEDLEDIKARERCERCGGLGRKWITDRVVPGQGYGPETEGHYGKCMACNGTGKKPKLRK